MLGCLSGKLFGRGTIVFDSDIDEVVRWLGN